MTTRKIIHGKKLIDALRAAGLVPDLCTRVVIEADYDNAARIHYSVVGDDRLLEVVNAGGIITVEASRATTDC